MKWLKEETGKPFSSRGSESKFVRFSEGRGNNKNATHMFLSKSLLEEAEEKGYELVRLGVGEKDGKKVLGFNFNKSYGGIKLKTKNGTWRKLFNVNGYLKAYEEQGVDIPMNKQLKLTKEGQIIYIIYNYRNTSHVLTNILMSGIILKVA